MKKPLDPTRCKAQVCDFTSWHWYQCQRKATKDGWCWQHHPDKERARHDASVRRFYEEREVERMTNAQTNHEQPIEEIAVVNRAGQLVSWVCNNPSRRAGLQRGLFFLRLLWRSRRWPFIAWTLSKSLPRIRAFAATTFQEVTTNEHTNQPHGR